MFPTVHGIVSQGGKGATPQPPSGIQIIGVTTGANAGGDVSVSYPAGVQAGDVLVIFLTYGGSLFPTAGRAPGFDVLAMASSTAPLLMLVRTADGEETGVTFSFGRNVAWVAYALRGAVAWPHAEIESLGAASIDPPSLTPSWGSSANLWLAAAKFTRTASTSFDAPPTNYAGLQTVQFGSDNQTINNHGRMATAHRLHAAASEDPGAFTTTGTLANEGAITAAVRPLVGEASPLRWAIDPVRMSNNTSNSSSQRGNAYTPSSPIRIHGVRVAVSNNTYTDVTVRFWDAATQALIAEFTGVTLSSDHSLRWATVMLPDPVDVDASQQFIVSVRRSSGSFMELRRADTNIPTRSGISYDGARESSGDSFPSSSIDLLVLVDFAYEVLP